MILNGYYYPDKQWEKLPHRLEASGEYVDDEFTHEKVFTGDYEGDIFAAFIQGNREAGKSVGVGIFLIADFLLFGYENILLRRYATDFTDKNAMEAFWMKSWPYREEFVEVVKRSPRLQKIYPLELVKSFDWKDHTLTFKNNMAFIDDKPFSHDASLYGQGPNNFKQRVFHNVHKIVYDEYISEEGAAKIQGEITAFNIIVETAARGRSDAKITFGCIFISNAVTMDNIWAKAYGFKHRMRKDSKFITDTEKSYCLEIVTNKIVAEEVKKSPMGRFFMGSAEGQKYLSYSQDNEYQDDMSYVERLTGDMRYLCNVSYENNVYAMKFSYTDGLYYFTNEGIDKQFKNSYAVTREDHTLDTVLITTALRQRFISAKLAYASGQMRFSDIASKNVFMDIYPLL